MTVSKSRRFIYAFLAALFVVLSIGSFIATRENAVYAEPGDGIICAGSDEVMGFNMSPAGEIVDDSVTDTGARRLNFEELYGDFNRKTLYYGEGGGDKWFGVYGLDPSRYDGALDATAADKATSLRKANLCFLGPFMATVAQTPAVLSRLITLLNRQVITLLFNPHIFCSSATDTNCVPISNIVGGRGAQGAGAGIIGSLTNSIYLPLSGLAVLLSALIIIKRGLFERKFREAFGMAAWVAVSFMVFLALLWNPSTLARAPMSFTNTVVGCVAGAMTGNGCGGDQVGTDTDYGTSAELCAGSYDGGSTDQAAQVQSSNVNCLIYKALTLETYARSRWGMSLAELDATSGTTFGKAAEAAGVDLKTFCVPMTVDRAPNQSTYGLPVYGESVCNGLVYAAYLQSGARAGGLPDQVNGTDAYPSPGKLDKRWYNLINVMAHTDSAWSTWTSTGWTRGGGFFISAVASVFAVGLSIVMGIQGLMYLLSGVILLAFSPFFCLIGLHPTRGKKIFLGYAGNVLSTIAKAILTSLLVLLYITVMGALIGTTANPWLGIILVFALSAAMFSYRKVFFDLLGTVDLGGEKLAAGTLNLNAAKNKAVRVGGSMAMGAILSDKKGLRRAGDGFAAAKEATSRELSRGRGFTAGAFQQKNRIDQGRRTQARDIQQQNVAAAEDARTRSAVALHTAGEFSQRAAVVGTKAAEVEGKIALKLENNERVYAAQRRDFNGRVNELYANGQLNSAQTMALQSFNQSTYRVRLLEDRVAANPYDMSLRKQLDTENAARRRFADEATKLGASGQLLKLNDEVFDSAGLHSKAEIGEMAKEAVQLRRSEAEQLALHDAHEAHSHALTAKAEEFEAAAKEAASYASGERSGRVQVRNIEDVPDVKLDEVKVPEAVLTHPTYVSSSEEFTRPDGRDEELDLAKKEYRALMDAFKSADSNEDRMKLSEDMESAIKTIQEIKNSRLNDGWRTVGGEASGVEVSTALNVKEEQEKTIPDFKGEAPTTAPNNKLGDLGPLPDPNLFNGGGNVK